MIENKGRDPGQGPREEGLAHLLRGIEPGGENL